MRIFEISGRNIVKADAIIEQDGQLKFYKISENGESVLVAKYRQWESWVEVTKNDER